MIHSLSLHNISCARNDALLFKPVQFSLASGQMLHIKGPNGIGKTSLLRCIAGFLKPATGEILWSQQSITDLDDYQSNIGYLGHKLAIKPTFTVTENLVWSPAKMLPSCKLEIDQVLTKLEIISLRNRLSGTLSSGQKQRLAVARLCLSQSTLWIMDEAFNSLDDQGKELVKKLMEQHLQNRGMIIFTAHQSEIGGSSYQSLELSSLEC